MITLSIDTSTQFLGIAAVTGEKIIFSHVSHIGRAHGELLMPTIVELFEEHSISPKDLGTIIAGVGPGSYTGIKIAHATGKGLARGSGAELLGYSSLVCLIPQVSDDEPFHLLVSAGRGRFYAQQFHVQDGVVSVLTDPWRLAADDPHPDGKIVVWEESHGIDPLALTRVTGATSRNHPYYL